MLQVAHKASTRARQRCRSAETRSRRPLSICPIILWTVRAPHDVTTNLRHSSLSSAFLMVSLSPKPVHSQMLSSHRFLCLPLLLPPCTVPWRNVLARPEDLVMCPCLYFSIQKEKKKRNANLCAVLVSTQEMPYILTACPFSLKSEQCSKMCFSLEPNIIVIIFILLTFYHSVCSSYFSISLISVRFPWASFEITYLIHIDFKLKGPVSRL